MRERNGQIHWRRRRQAGFHEMYVDGVFGTAPVINALNAESAPLSKDIRQKVKEVLEGGWRTTRELFDAGGMLSGTGRRVEVGINSSSIPEAARDGLGTELYTSIPVSDLRRLMGADAKIRELGFSPGEDIHLLNQGAAEHVGYYSGSLIAFLKIGEGRARMFRGMEGALVKYFARLFSEQGLKQYVAPKSAGRQIIYQLAMEGLGQKRYRDMNYGEDD